MLDISCIKAISLDLDDTLWPVWPTIARAEARLQEWLQDRAPATALVFSDTGQRNALRAQADTDWPQRRHDLSFMRREMIRQGLERNGEDQGLADAAFEVFFAARQEVTLFDDAHGALAALSARWPVLALSNGNADVQRIGIGHYFCASVSARDADAAKPDPRIFAMAAQRLQLAPHEILHVGDDAHMDVLGALQAGMQAAWVNRNGHVWSLDAQPQATVSDMAELCKLLGAS
jgi:putative hydrolase of the HAD superfamily